MVMCCIPAVPMPMLMNKCIIDECGLVCTEEAVGNSHDLIAKLMDTAAQTSSGAEAVHKERRVKQEAAFKRLIDSVDAGKGQAFTVDYYYSAFAEFTRSYIQAYLMGGTDHDIRFLPPCRVCKGDPIHKAAGDFVRAQAIMSGKGGQDLQWSHMEYAEIVMYFALELQRQEGS